MTASRSRVLTILLVMALFSLMLFWFASLKGSMTTTTLIENKRPVITGKVLFDGTSPATTNADGADGY